MLHYPEFMNNSILLYQVNEVLRSIPWHIEESCSVGANAESLVEQCLKMEGL
jgi:hypothetical protein